MTTGDSGACTGTRWKKGTGTIICPVCHLGWRSILGTGKPGARPLAGESIPAHARRGS